MGAAVTLPRMLRPCGGRQPCPWRLDAPAGQFPRERWDALRVTSRQADEYTGHDAPIGAPMFGCHATPGGRERVCAGWLAVEGMNHIGVRLALFTGALPRCALTPGEDWPALYRSYADLAAANGATPVLTQDAKPATIGGMSQMTETRQAPKRRTATYRFVETLLKARHPDQPDLTLESWVRSQRNLGVAWRPMSPRLAEAAGLAEADLPVGSEALRRWFEYLDDEDEATEIAARTVGTAD